MSRSRWLVLCVAILLPKLVNAQSMRLQDAPLGSVVQIGSFNYIKIAENKYMQSSAVTCPDLAKVGNKYVKCYDTYEEAASGGSCACGTGYVFDGSYKSGIGACKLSCGIYSSIDSDNPFSCNCDAGYYVDSSYTKTSYNTIKTSCSYLKCGALSSQTSGNNSSCTCTSGYSVDADWKTTSYINVGGKCTYLICGEHSYQNTTNVLQCDCESGWTYTGGKSSYTAVGGACDQNCPAGTIYSDADKACKAVCGDGTPNLVYDGDNPICDFDYTGGIQTFTATVAGAYKLEVWGAQGGLGSRIGGYGGYSVGSTSLSANEILYVVVGGKGTDGNGGMGTTTYGGYNGGGTGHEWGGHFGGGGGGATHIATAAGLLSSLSNNTNTVKIVAGGGGGGGGLSFYWGGQGGGIKGGDGYFSGTNYGYGTGGTQSAGGCYGNNCTGSHAGSFGLGGEGEFYGPGGGGGWYGGGGANRTSAGGGSGYIGGVNNSTMYCSDGSNTDTHTACGIGTNSTSGPNVSETAQANYAKSGNGYARITLISVD